MDLEFTGEVWFWRGPAPHHFLSVPDELCGGIEHASARVTYGWGMVPVTARLGSSQWATSLWPKDGGYIVPLRAQVRRREQVELGDTVTVGLTIDL
jgi:hypothetical protein